MVRTSMGDLQENRGRGPYTCKICGKTCVSGRSLGGHMRKHLSERQAQIQSAKSPIAVVKEGDGIGTSGKEETRLADPDHNPPGYELRDNPKKSRRISPESAAAKPGRKISCHCKECGRGFFSDKAMYGHMKTHSKKSSPNPPAAAAADAVHSEKTLAPVRRKRSRTHYRNHPSLPEKEAAAALLLLAANRVNFHPTPFSADDNSAYYGGRHEYSGERQPDRERSPKRLRPSSSSTDARVEGSSAVEYRSNAAMCVVGGAFKWSPEPPPRCAGFVRCVAAK
ncbi:hypothetical protein M569_00602 [Genlisea aurea]|uniref:C2H2-type domain-containing protein n=1 Tax=Genlisea aurea TaxID=192259 RepID=S8EDU9_9LAMI|nr:hypothetical protein M569_00602 [Genlisea aurea]